MNDLSHGARRHARVGLGLVGAGAFGTFAVPHLSPFFDIVVHDPRPDIGRLCAEWGVAPVDLAGAASRRIVLVAVPLAALRAVARAMAPHLASGGLVVDVCSVKMRPLAILREELPPGTRIVGTHPLFGPNSGRNGIAGLKAVVCRDGGRGGQVVARFMGGALGLDVLSVSPEAHDRQMAYVQGLSHLVARSLAGLALPDTRLQTAAFAQLDGLVDLVGSDSDALFETVVGGNPFAPDVLGRFVEIATALVVGVTSCAGE